MEELRLDKEIIITSSISDPSFFKSDPWVFLVTLISLDTHIRLTGEPNSRCEFAYSGCVYTSQPLMTALIKLIRNKHLTKHG